MTSVVADVLGLVDGTGVGVGVGDGTGTGLLDAVGVGVGVAVGVEPVDGLPDVHVTELPSAERTQFICDPLVPAVGVDDVELDDAGRGEPVNRMTEVELGVWVV